MTQKRKGIPVLTPDLIRAMVRACFNGADCKACPAYGLFEPETGERVSCTEVLSFAEHAKHIVQGDVGKTTRNLIGTLIDPLYADLLKVKEAADGE